MAPRSKPSNSTTTTTNKTGGYSAEEFESKKVELESLTRGERISQLEHKLTAEKHKTKAEEIKAQIAGKQTEIVGKDLERTDIQLTAAGVKVNIENSKLRLLKADENGEAQMAQFQEELWQVRIEGRRSDISQARAMLASKQAEFQARMIEG